MRIRIIAVGQHIAGWAQEATEDYLSRFPKGFDVSLKEIRTEPRTIGMTPAKLMQAEAERIVAAIDEDDYVIVLDEHGADFTTMNFAKSLAKHCMEGDQLVFVIGGPDGLAPEVKALAKKTMRLSAMTLPHAMARVMLAEQIFRAWSILVNHPYHRA